MYPHNYCAGFRLTHTQVAKRARRGTVLGGAATPVDAAEETMDGFGPLRKVLGAISDIYANHQVRLRPLFRILL